MTARRRALGLLVLLLAWPSGAAAYEHFELGDALYSNFSIGCVNTCYDHAGILVGVVPGLYAEPQRRVVEGTIPVAQEVSLAGFELDYPPCTREGYDFPARRDAAKRALWLVGKSYPTECIQQGEFNSLDALVPDLTDGFWDGGVPDIRYLRCDGLVEYCIESTGLAVWATASAWDITRHAEYPIHNELPPLGAPCDGCYFYPRTQRSGQDCGAGTSYSWLEPRLAHDDPSIDAVEAHYLAGDEIRVLATDLSSGIAYLKVACTPAGEAPGALDWEAQGFRGLDPDLFPGSTTREILIYAGLPGDYHIVAVDWGGNLSAEALVPDYVPIYPQEADAPLDAKRFAADLPAGGLARLEIRDAAWTLRRELSLDPGARPETLGDSRRLDLLGELPVDAPLQLLGYDRFGRQRYSRRISPRGLAPSPPPAKLGAASAQAARLRARLATRGDRAEPFPVRSAAAVIADPEPRDFIIYSSDARCLEHAHLMAYEFLLRWHLIPELVLGPSPAAADCAAVARAVYEANQAGAWGRPPFMIIVGHSDQLYLDGPVVRGVELGWSDYSDALLFDFDGDAIPDMPWSRVPLYALAQGEELDYSLSEMTSIDNALCYYRGETFAGGGALILDGHSEKLYGAGGDFTCFDHAAIAAFNQGLAAEYNAAGIAATVLDPAAVPDGAPCVDTPEKAAALRQAMAGGVCELFAFGAESSQDLLPGKFLRRGGYDLDDWPDQGYVLNLICCSTAWDRLSVPTDTGAGSLFMDWLFKDPTATPGRGGHAVAVIGHKHSRPVGEHMRYAAALAQRRSQRRDRFYQEAAFQAYRTLALSDPRRIDYLKGLAFLGWPAPIADTIVSAPLPAAAGGGLKVGAYPNPFNPSLTVQILAPAGSAVEIAVLDVLGRVVRDEPGRRLDASGRLEWRWDGRDERGRRASSGVYFLRVQAVDGVVSRKVVLLR